MHVGSQNGVSDVRRLVPAAVSDKRQSRPLQYVSCKSTVVVVVILLLLILLVLSATANHTYTATVTPLLLLLLLVSSLLLQEVVVVAVIVHAQGPKTVLFGIIDICT